MSGFTFFPRLDDALIENAGIDTGHYLLSYQLDGVSRRLTTYGKPRITVEDPSEIWKIEKDGLSISCEVLIEYPAILHGSKGIACSSAEIGACLIWTNAALSQMGYILPEDKSDSSVLRFSFSHFFAPGELSGDLSIDTVLYIKKPAAVVPEDEQHLINEAGVSIGIIDSSVFKLSSQRMDFPIVEDDIKNGPLWWIDIKWEDPTTDAFDEDSVCLHLNSAHPSCPKIGSEITHEDVLIEIISTAYLVIFTELKADDCLDRVMNNVDLEPGSVAMMMRYFYESSDPKLQTESAASLQKTIRATVEKMLKGGDENEA